MTEEIDAEHGESKASKRKSTRDPWYKRYPARFRRDTLHEHQMPFDLRCQWSLLVDLFYEHDGALPNDDRWIAMHFGCDVRKWKHIRRELEAIGKIWVGADGLIHNKTADEVITERDDKLAKKAPVAPKTRRLGKAATPASTPATTPPSTPATTSLGTEAHLSETPNDINDGASKQALYARATKTRDLREEKKIDPFSSVASGAEKDDERRVVFSNGKIEIHNGMRAYWLDRFGGDADRLELGLIQAAAFVQPNSSRPLEAQVAAQLARQCGEKIDRDKRYAAVSAQRSRDPPQVSAKMAALLEFKRKAFPEEAVQ